MVTSFSSLPVSPEGENTEKKKRQPFYQREKNTRLWTLIIAHHKEVEHTAVFLLFFVTACVLLPDELNNESAKRKCFSGRSTTRLYPGKVTAYNIKKKRSQAVTLSFRIDVDLPGSLLVIYFISSCC